MSRTHLLVTITMLLAASATACSSSEGLAGSSGGLPGETEATGDAGSGDAEPGASSLAVNVAWRQAGRGISSGACGHSCDDNARVLVHATQPVGIAVREGAVYWALASGDVMSAPSSGGPATTLFTNTQDGGPAAGNLSVGLAVDATRVYWAENLVPLTTYVQSVLLDGASIDTFDVAPRLSHAVQAIAGDGTNLYVARYDFDQPGGRCPSVGIDIAPLDHGPVTTLTGACRVQRLAVDDSGTVYWTDLGPPPADTPAAVMSQSASATTPTTLARATSPWGIAVYGGRLYWSDGPDIRAVTLGAAAAPSVVVSSTQPQDLVVDASGIYWIDSGTTVVTAPLEGGRARTLASGQAGATALATDSTTVYWVDRGTEASGYTDGAVMAIAK